MAGFPKNLQSLGQEICKLLWVSYLLGLVYQRLAFTNLPGGRIPILMNWFQQLAQCLLPQDVLRDLSKFNTLFMDC